MFSALAMLSQVCRPNGYFTVVDFENLSDIWAFCVLRLVIRKDNSGAPDNIMYDQPLGWWDAHWPGSHNAPGCFTNDAPVNDTYFEVRPLNLLPPVPAQGARRHRSGRGLQVQENLHCRHACGDRIKLTIYGNSQVWHGLCMEQRHAAD